MKDLTAIRRKLRTWTILLPVIFLGLSMFTALVVSTRLGSEMVKQVVPLQDASMMIKNELGLFNLSIEQSLYVSKTKYGENAWKHLDRAEWYARAMLEGGSGKEGVYSPVQDPQMRRDISRLIEELHRLRVLAEQRLSLGVKAATKSGVENDFSFAFNRAYRLADNVEGSLRHDVASELSEYEAISAGLLVASVVFTILTGATIYMYGRRRTEDILALTKSEARLKQNEKDLTEALERLRLLSTAVEEAPDGIQMVGLDGRIVYSNKAVERIYGFTPDEFTGMDVNELNLDPEIASREIIPAVNSTGRWAGEIMVKRKDGRPVPILLTASMVRDGAGKPVAMVGIIRDITERKRALEDLRYQKLLLECLAEASPDGILVSSDDGRMLTFNQRFVEMWGLPAHVVESRSDEMALSSILGKLKDPDAFLERVRYLNKHRFEHSREELSLSDGRSFDRFSAPVIGTDGVHYGRVWFFRDITERKVLERQRVDFYAMVTHDLKSPLSAIRGYSELLLTIQGNAFDKDTTEMVAGIHRSGKKLLRIVEDFLTFSRLESGTASLNGTLIDVGILLDDLHREFSPLAAEKGLSLTVGPGEGLPRAVLDKGLVERALQNLIQNAVLYTPRGGEITVEAGALEENSRSFISFLVSDNGPGIPAEDQGRIFEKYYRSPRTAGVKGTGLGLAIVKAVAGAHGGRVELESAEGSGSTFRLILPVE